MGDSDNFFGSNSNNSMSSNEISSRQHDLLMTLKGTTGINQSNSVTSSSSASPLSNSSNPNSNQISSSSNQITTSNSNVTNSSINNQSRLNSIATLLKGSNASSGDSKSSSNITKSNQSDVTSKSDVTNSNNKVTPTSDSTSSVTSKKTSITSSIKSSKSDAKIQQELMAQQGQDQIKQLEAEQDLDVTPDNQENNDENQLDQLINSSKKSNVTSNSSSNNTLSSISSISQSSGNVANSTSSGYASRRQPLNVTLSNSDESKSINHVLGSVNQKYVKVKPKDKHPLLANERIKQSEADVIISPENVLGAGNYNANYSPDAVFNKSFPTKEAKTKYAKQWAKRVSKIGKAKYNKIINHLKELKTKYDAQVDKQSDKDGQKKQQNRQQGVSRK